MRRTSLRLKHAALALAATSLLAQPSAHAQTSSEPTLAQLRAGFADPPPQARLRCYWFWLNGNTDKPTITHDLEEMKSKGFGGALLVDANGSDQEGNRGVPAGPTFGSPAWTELFLHALREADRLGLEITLNVGSGWNLGDPGVTPKEATKLLTWSRTTVHGGGAIHLALPMPPEKNGYYRQLAVLAYPLHGDTAAAETQALRLRSAAAETGFSMPDSDWMLDPHGVPAGSRGPRQASGPADTSGIQPAEIHDLTAQTAADGSLTWNAPAGDWELLRIGYTDSSLPTCALPCGRTSTSSGVWQGLAIDYMSREAFDSYWHRVVEPLLTAAKPYGSLKYVTEDSLELGGINWTEEFRAQFTRRRGYDPVPWLPVVAGRTVESAEASTRFLADLRRTVADLIAENHYDRFAARAAEFHLGVQAESGGPHGAPIDALENFRRSAIPQTEFWSENPHRSRDGERYFTKEAASAANLYGKRLVASEGETDMERQWNESLATDLKPSFDMAVTEGLNRLVWHEFTSSPAATGLPGQEYFAGTHLNPKVTWWNAAPAFLAYLNRVQFLMQAGTPVDDLLYFEGDNVPSQVRLKADDPAHVLPGYDYDVTDEDALLHTLHAAGSTLTSPSGVAWRALALPHSGRLSLSALERIAQYVAGGGNVIGLAPSSPTGLTDETTMTRFHSLVQQIWGPDCIAGSHHPYGKGAVYCTADAHAALTAMQLAPDVQLLSLPHGPMAASDSTFDYIHRRIGSADIYYLRNGSAQPVSEDAIFRSSAAAVEQWNAVTGEVNILQPAADSAPGRTHLKIALPPFGSALVVFSSEPHTAAPPALAVSHTLPVTAAWSLSFPPGRGAPPKPVSLTTFESWTASTDPTIRYFSGTATYRTTVPAPAADPGAHVSLHFTEIHEIARISINGHDAGTIWAQPLTLRVDPWLRPGTNLIEIEVTNFWPNRIIGDLQPGRTQQPITSTNITRFRPDSPLLPSGLIGPVTWLIEH